MERKIFIFEFTFNSIMIVIIFMICLSFSVTIDNIFYINLIVIQNFSYFLIKLRVCCYCYWWNPCLFVIYISGITGDWLYFHCITCCFKHLESVSCYRYCSQFLCRQPAGFIRRRRNEFFAAWCGLCFYLSCC